MAIRKHGGYATIAGTPYRRAVNRTGSLAYSPEGKPLWERVPTQEEADAGTLLPRLTRKHIERAFSERMAILDGRIKP